MLKNKVVGMIQLDPLRQIFGNRLQEAVPLARHTVAHLGGSADALFEAQSVQEMVDAVSLAWECNIPLIILGGGSNVLVSEAGVRGLVIINRARQVRFDEQSNPPTVWAESGANFGLLARQAAQRGLAGLEWAAGIPGTLGGAIVGNAGAHNGDMAGNLRLAEILHRRDDKEHQCVAQREEWPVEKLAFVYRGSVLKRQASTNNIVLSALLKLEHSTPPVVQVKIDEWVDYRKRTQPPGASLGSMFKNPPGDYAGRLIEAAGLKGFQVGDAQISPVHANFIINLGHASAADYFALIQLARQKVAEKFAVNLELEIECIGEW